MDRNTVIGFVLIGIVLMIWMWMNAPPPGHENTLKKDSMAVRGDAVRDSSHRKKEEPREELQASPDSVGKYFSAFQGGQEKFITIHGDLYDGRISSRGAKITSWELEKFKDWSGKPVNLINRERGGDCSLLFYTSDGKLIDTKNLMFALASAGKSEYQFGDQESLRIDFQLQISAVSRIVKSYIFFRNQYAFDVLYRFDRMESIVSNYEYQVVWENGLKYQERNSVDESNSAMAYSYAGGELVEVDAAKADEPPVKQNISGRVQWVAMRNKYFALGFLPRGVESQGAYLEGVRLSAPNGGAEEFYNIGLRLPFLGKAVEQSRVTVVLAPLDFDLVKSYKVGLENIMSLGAAWIIRPITEYVMIPLLQLIHLVIPNYGFVIIVFSLIIKVVLYPLTKTSMRSMRKMQALQPMMEEVRAKHKDDPEKMNQQVMRLYQEYGVNPFGGCFPMLLQMPILYALWAVFRSAIELRQAAFIWWIDDLSIPDVITKLPFSIPLFNVTELSGLALLMGVTMFVQQKMTVKDPRQKTMVWMMPVLMTLLFNSFPAGLNLYYFVFNLLSIGQQYWFNYQHRDEPLRKVEQKKSGGFLSRLTKHLPQKRT